MRRRIRDIFLLLAAVSMFLLPASAVDRTNLRPGWNLFSPQQDTEMGRALSDEAEQTLAIVGPNDASTYIDALGRQLAVHAPGPRYSYQFKIIDDSVPNTYALPGGFIYVTSGLIQAANNEPQLAGLIAHQIAHIALRQGTHEVSNAYADQYPDYTRGRVTVGDVMADLNIHFENGSPALQFTRDEENQSDILATQILVDSGFDPRQMTQFFERVQNSLNSHQNSGNRSAAVRNELAKMGGLPRNLRGDSPDFHTVVSILSSSNRFSTAGNNNRYGNPDSPSSRLTLYRGRDFQFRYPDNWTVNDETDGIYIIPGGGMVSGSLAYGMRIATFQPTDDRFIRTPFAAPSDRSSQTSLGRATNQLLDDLRRSNPNMRVVRNDQGRRVDGEQAMVMELTNDSPLGGVERDWLVTVLHSDGLLYYFVGAAPDRDFNRYMATFDQIVSNTRFNR